MAGNMLAILVTFLTLFGQGLSQALPPCASQCVASMLNDGTHLNCPLGNTKCICSNEPNLGYGITDCVTQSCRLTGTELDAVVSSAKHAASSSCEPIRAASTTIRPPTTATTPTTSPSPMTSTSGTAVKSSAAMTGSDALGSGKTATSSLSTHTSPPPTRTTTSAAGGSPMPSSGTNADQSTRSSGGLGSPVKVAIGVSIAAAFLFLAMIALVIVLRRRKALKERLKKGPNSPPRPPRSPSPAMQISDPLPGSGRQFASDAEATVLPGVQGFPPLHSPSSHQSAHSPKSQYSTSQYSHDVEPKGRRYEDMTSQPPPRTMF